MGGRSSKEKGKRGERATAAEIREAFPELADDIRRGWQSRRGSDDSDVVGFGRFHVEVKCGKKPNPRAALEQAEEDSKEKNKIPIAVIRDDYEAPFVVLRWEHFLQIIRSVKNATDGADEVLREGCVRALLPGNTDGG